MSVIVKGMDMPKNCGSCPFYSFESESKCYISKHFVEYIDLPKGRFRPLWCPLDEAEPVRHGRWVNGNEMPDYPRVPYRPYAMYCSACRGEAYWDADYELFDYCPYCGAKMDEVEE